MEVASDATCTHAYGRGKGKGKPPPPPPATGKGLQASKGPPLPAAPVKRKGEPPPPPVKGCAKGQANRTESVAEVDTQSEPPPKPDATTSLAIIGELQLSDGSWTLDDNGKLASAVGVARCEFRRLLIELTMPAVSTTPPWETVFATSTGRQAIERCATIVVAEADTGLQLDQKERRRRALAIAEAKSALGTELLSSAQRWLDEVWSSAAAAAGVKAKLEQKRVMFESKISKMLDAQLPRPDWKKALKAKKNVRVTCQACGKEFSGAVGKCPSCSPPEAPMLQRQSTADLLRRWRQFSPAPVGRGLLHWSAAESLLHIGGGSGGVTLLKVPQGVICIKPLMMNAVAEFFAGRVAEFLDIPIAKSSVVSMAHEEFMHIKEAIRVTPAEIEEDRAIARRSHGRTEFIALLEFVPGFSLQGLEVHSMLQGMTAESMQDFWCKVGRLIAFDVLINNVDRVPLLWDNEGNTANLMLLLQSKEDSGLSVIGIDQAVTAIVQQGPGRSQYLDRVSKLVHAAFCDSTKADSAVTAVSSTWSVAKGLTRLQEAFRVSCGIEVDHTCLMAGVREGLTQIADRWEDGSLENSLATILAGAQAAFSSATVDVGVRSLPTMADFLSVIAATIAAGRASMTSSSPAV